MGNPLGRLTKEKTEDAKKIKNDRGDNSTDTN